jgi:hypothetical protein
MENENTELEIIPQTEIQEVAKEITPVSQIEQGLADFLGHTFDMVLEEDLYFKEIKKEVVKRLPTMKDSEIIALSTNTGTLFNDRQSKILAPTMQLLSAAQQAEMAKAQKEIQNQQNVLSQVNVRELNQVTPNEVQVGMKALMDLIQAANSGAANTNP